MGSEALHDGKFKHMVLPLLRDIFSDIVLLDDDPEWNEDDHG
jgi:hypothetical protein